LARAFAYKHQSLAKEIINMSFFFYIDANVAALTLAKHHFYFMSSEKKETIGRLFEAPRLWSL
jgi:hypothetical protein